MSGRRKVIVSNQSSTTPVIVSSIFTTGDFSMVTNCGASIGPRTSCWVNVRFTPTAFGRRIGTLNVDSNAGNSPSAVDLTGEGVQGK